MKINMPTVYALAICFVMGCAVGTEPRLPATPIPTASLMEMAQRYADLSERTLLVAPRLPTGRVALPPH